MRTCRLDASVALLLVIGFAACRPTPPRPAAALDSGPGRSVATAEAVRTGGAGATVPAVVQARQRAALSARIVASVIELPYREGEPVAAGAVVARLDDAALRSAVAAAEAGVKAAEADRARTENLLRKSAATPRELEEVTARAAAARASLLLARDNVSYAVLRAPFAGRVAGRPANVGDVVSPGVPIVEIEGLGGLELLASVGGEVAERVRPGLRMPTRVDGQERPVEAVVRSVSPAGDPATHRFEVRADLPAAPGLRAGLFARLVVPGPSTETRITVPAGALVERGGLTGVFVVKEGRARLRWVSRGAAVGDAVEIRAGLEAGERVALDPAGLEEGERVTPASTTRESGGVTPRLPAR